MKSARSVFTYSDKKSKEVKWRDLVCPKKLKLFSKISLPQMYPDLPNAQKYRKYMGRLYLFTMVI